jgi:hypothetical protein
MDASRILPKVPSYVQFRVLIIGKANAGKTTILQRVCDTTESPVIYRRDKSRIRNRLRSHDVDLTSSQVQFDPSVEVGSAYLYQRWLIVRILLVQRGEHDIEDEFVFTNHKGYVFHDSRGFESGDDSELKIVQEFVSRTSRERRLNGRLHAIWLVPLCTWACRFTSCFFRYCVPMDNARPSLDLKYFNDICPDTNGASKH